MSHFDCAISLSSSDTESDEDFSDPKMIVLRGDKTPQEVLLQKKGCFRDLQVFRYNICLENYHIEEFIPLLYREEELRKNCQEEIALKENAHHNPKLWGSGICGGMTMDGSLVLLGPSHEGLSHGGLTTRGICIQFLLKIAKLGVAAVAVTVDAVSVLNVKRVQQGYLELGIAL
ncbi:hypothetical protein PENSTE_c002G00536 [Penicillium steckii]|uniref:Uncharacterized protein n=1 Tax=Penicillium steckii TaxID=303698 RepID=A0A1V6TVI6_9EURO|nr:hypothetical protein PENSTE_c002G00536 [Penicillium steckii]